MRPDDYERTIGPLTLAYHARAWVDMEPHIGTLAGLARSASHALEVGVRGGVSTWAILDGLPDSGRLTSIDAVDVLAEGMIPHRVYADHRWTFMHGDAAAVMDVLDETFDLVFIDAGHGYYETIVEVREAIRLGARTIALHDYLLPPVRDAVELCGVGWSIEYEPSTWGLAVMRR